MALSSELRVYKDTYELTSYIMDRVQDFPKVFKYNLGSRLIDSALLCLGHIERANTDMGNRVQHLTDFQVEFATLKTLMSLCKDRKLINLRQAANFGRFSSNIGRKIGGWKKSALRAEYLLRGL